MKTKLPLLATFTVFATALHLAAQEPKGPPPGGFGQGGPGQKGPPGQKGGPGGQGGNFGGGGGEGFRPPQHPLEMALDANGDGVIDAKELANAALVLKRLDKNGDGRLTSDEFRPARPSGGGFGGQPGGPGQGGPGQKGQKGGPGGQGGFGGEPGGPDGQKGAGGQVPKSDGDFVSRLFQNDKNNDGKITKNELPEGLQGIFERADTNKDGAIDRREAGVLAERMKSRSGTQGTDGKRPPLEK